MSNWSGVGTYSYATSKPHTVSRARTNNFVYYANGNMTHRNAGNTRWEYQYNAENTLVQIDKDGFEVNCYLYDGDENRVAEINAGGDETIFIGNYFEAVFPQNSIPDPPPPTYNVFVCGIGDGNNCGGTDPGTPLYPYYSWPGANAYFDVDKYGNKASTVNSILGYLDDLPNRSKLRFIGHSAGADAVLLTIEGLSGSNSVYDFRLLGVVLLDTSLSGGPYKNVGGMLPIIENLIDSKIPTFIVTTTSYPTDSVIPVSSYIPLNDAQLHPNYHYYNLAHDSIFSILTHAELALNTDIASTIWVTFHGGR